MNTKPALISQYQAGMKVLNSVIEKCPESMWNVPAHDLRAIWRVVYHTLFFTDYYLQKDHQSFKTWAMHQEDAPCLGLVTWENNRRPKECTAYTKAEMLEYWSDLDGRISSLVDAQDLESSDSGFPWYQMSKFEHQLVNIRHLQHHAAALSVRLKEFTGIDIPWVSAG